MLGRCSIFTPSPPKEVDALRDLAVVLFLLHHHPRKLMPSVTSPSTPNPSSPHHPAKQQAIAAEQTYVDMLFDRLDKEVEEANQRLNEVQADVDPANPDSDALVRRETEYHLLHGNLDRLNLAQLGLVFGRIDVDAPGDNPTEEGLDRRYIGRMGLDAREDNYRTLLLDW